MNYQVCTASDSSTWAIDGVKVLAQSEDEPIRDGYQVIASGLAEPMARMVACLYIELMADEAERMGAHVLQDGERPEIDRLAARHAIRGLSRKRRNAELRSHGYEPDDRYRALLSMAMLGRDMIRSTLTH